MVRLVAAIVAAHPDMKLNYAGKPGFSFCLHIVVISLDLTIPFCRCCFTLRFSSTHSPDHHISDIAKYHGGGCTYKAVWGVMTTCKGNGDMLRKAFDGGIDPVTVVLKDGSSAMANGKAKSGSMLPFSPLPTYTVSHMHTLPTYPNFC